MDRGGAGARYGLPLLAFFMLIAGALVARSMLGAATQPLINDTDDAMRLVVVRDLVAGQGWYDHVQHRLNTPFGAELHWSRLVDLPLAGLLLLLRPVFGAFAETLMVYLWPLALLLALLWLYARLAQRLVGREGLLPALALPGFSLVTLAEFAPGRIDHHSVQILLLLLTLLLTIGALERPRLAIGAGLAAATGLAIGIESLPGVASAILAFGLLWVFRPERADALLRFGLSFGLGTAAHLALALPPERWLTPACDALSPVYAVAALGTGAGFVLLSLLPLGRRGALVRLAAGLAVGAALLLALLAAFPGCFRGPYSDLDPWLVANWIDRIAEAEPLLVALLKEPTYPLAVGLPPLLGLAAVAVRLWREPADGRAQWLVYGLFLAVAFVVMLLQIRGARLATSLAVPAGAWAIVALRGHYLARRTLPRIAGLAAGWIGFAGLGIAILANLAIMAFPDYEASIADPGLAARTQCRMPQSFAALAALPPGRVMAPVDLGAHLLAFTPHAVVAAPYHRNAEGVQDAFRFFSGPIAGAEAILAARGIAYVVTCPALPELGGVGEVAPDAFIRLDAAGALPAALEPLGTPGGTLRIWRVRRL